MEIVDRSTLTEYRNMYEQLKNRDISASDGASQYKALVTEIHKSQTIVRGIDQGAPTIFNGFSLVNPDTFNQASQYVPDNMSAQSIIDQYHQRGGNHKGVNRLHTIGMGGKHLSQVKYEFTMNPTVLDNNPIHKYNLESVGFLEEYAATHEEEWKQAAKDLSINASKENGSYYTHFFKRPKGVEYNFGEGEAKSQAEMIFRHIASDDEIAQFEGMMRPAQGDLDNFAYNLLENITDASLDEYEGTTNSQFTVLKISEMLQDEGIDISQAKSLSFARNVDDSFYVQDEVPNKAAIEEAINNNQDIYNFLSGIWQG
ncbi:hypothetical protein [Terasakiella pusilla]|uniref:hypothetical protein n=1 Tax=Terasakiella pusilla TaxID=64973 RepID=UPI0012EBAD48|nr:hypothetical protein [Terasakiella pusilla]